MQCVDAETLAAWADGGLPKTEAAAVELHLSECDRCTAMVATFVRTTPDAPAVESLWTRWNLRWLVPVATAATVAALWVLIPQPAPVPAAIADTDVAPQAQPTAPTPTAAQPSPAVEAKRQEVAPPGPPSARPEDFAKRGDANASSSLERRQFEDQAREEQQAAVERQAPAAPPPAREADRADEKGVDLRERAAAAPAPAATRAAEAPRTGALQQGNMQGFAAVVAQLVIASPDPMTRWRVIGAGQVERSTNGGARWEPAVLPESATLTGGTSPAPSICWLVGRTGAIYVTTDGLRFAKVPFPDRTDFVSIQATDGRRATVITTDGRTMRTEDQGATWIRVAP